MVLVPCIVVHMLSRLRKGAKRASKVDPGWTYSLVLGAVRWGFATVKPNLIRKCLCCKALNRINIARENPILVLIVINLLHEYHRYRLKDVYKVTLSIYYSLGTTKCYICWNHIYDFKNAINPNDNFKTLSRKSKI